MAIGKHDVHSETYQNLYHNIITFKRPPLFSYTHSSLLNNSQTLVTPQQFSQADINSSTNTLDFIQYTINLH
jgi:hypothetical protein